ncbi:conserved hypothetical protein [Ricinus communis]|uniref:DUF4283 domain-containing protein n=1 Tax=Ricinus communis TaxID=3988 RepID=B9S5C2_RICCO|nr:conserved hypothetical protein [Ricinus communis]
MTTTEKHEDQMIVQYAKISLEDEEEGGLVFEDIGNANQAPEYQWSLVGRFLTDRAINFLAMKNTLASLWRPVKGVCIKELGPNLFIFQFFHELDMLHVIEGGPWTFNQFMLLTTRFHSDRFCEALFYQQDRDHVRPYGVWLRAPRRLMLDFSVKGKGHVKEVSTINGVRGKKSGEAGSVSTIKEQLIMGQISLVKVHKMLWNARPIKPNDYLSMELPWAGSGSSHEGCFFIAGVGIGGGLVLLWKEKNMAKLLSFSSNHIDASVLIPNMKAWHLTYFYGFPKRARRKDSWDLLHKLNTVSTFPWCVIEDFNDLMGQHEKKGRLRHPNHSLN